MKIAKGNFLKTSKSEKFRIIVLSDIRMRVINAMKFVIGKEVLPFGESTPEILNVLYGTSTTDNEFIPVDKKKNLFNNGTCIQSYHIHLFS